MSKEVVERYLSYSRC